MKPYEPLREDWKHVAAMIGGAVMAWFITYKIVDHDRDKWKEEAREAVKVSREAVKVSRDWQEYAEGAKERADLIEDIYRQLQEVVAKHYPHSAIEGMLDEYSETDKTLDPAKACMKCHDRSNDKPTIDRFLMDWQMQRIGEQRIGEQ